VKIRKQSSSRPSMDISQVLPLRKWVLNVPSDHKLLRMVLLLCKVLLSLELPSLSSAHQINSHTFKA
jgi:hypothetical protein